MVRLLLGNIKGEPGEVTTQQLLETRDVVESKINDISVNVKNYGATGNGVDDDSEYINNALSSGYKKIYIPHGEYVTNQPLIINSNDVVLYGEGVILSNTDTTLELSGSNCDIQINIEGQDNTRIGIYNSGKDNKIHDCVIKNIYSEDDMSCGINSVNSGLTKIKNNLIDRVNSVGDDIGGNNNGASRAIRIVGLSINDGETFIIDNTIKNVIGEEGDAIHLISSNKESMPVKIENNTINTFSRRAIKIQCSNVEVIKNKIINRTNHTSLIRVIDIQHSTNVNIINNDIDVEFVSVFGLAGTPDDIVEYINIRGNTVKSHSVISNIYNTNANEVNISNNEFIGGGNFLLSGTDNLDFNYNTIKHSLLSDSDYTLTINNGSNVNVIVNEISHSVYRRPLRTNAENIDIIQNLFNGDVGGFEINGGSGTLVKNTIKNTRLTTTDVDTHLIIDNTLIN